MKYFTMKEVSKLTGLSYHTVRHNAIKGKVKPLTVGHARLFTQDDIKKLQERYDIKMAEATK